MTLPTPFVPEQTSALPGSVRPRPERNRSQATPGVHPLPVLTHRTQRFQPLPPPLGEPPYHFDLETVLPGFGQTARELGKMVLHCVGDTGGIKDASFQADVAAAMKGDLLLPDAERPRFFYHLGDVVYYNGEIADYYDQFYEPYDHYRPPILGIPGNHDGDPNTTDPTQTSLDGWARYFMSPSPQVLDESKDAPRVTLSLPNPYWTLTTPFATFVGMYTNVPEGGSIDSVQQQWLTNEFATADKSKALVLALHHPVYSFDDHHSGSAAMADHVQHAINDSRRVPNLVLAAHVHNYQRIEREIVAGITMPFIVSGNGGYYHLHGMNATAPATDEQTGAKLLFEEHQHHGYMLLTIDAEAITAEVISLGSAKGNYKDLASVDSFSYSAKLITLPDNVVVSL